MGNKNKKSGLSVTFFRSIIFGIFAIFLVFVFCERMLVFLKSSDYFTIKDIWYESSLQSIESSELAGLKGKNLLQVDLKKIENQLQWRYPQYKHLMVLKRFPSQILVVAQKRFTFAQVRIAGHHATVDDKGAVVAAAGDLDSRLPLITGVSTPKSKITAGSLIENRELQLALRIIQVCQSDRVLAAYRISKIDVSNLSEIYFYIANNLKIVIDQENLDQKLKMLRLVLSQAKLEANGVKYIDLRFKEPVLGKK